MFLHLNLSIETRNFIGFHITIINFCVLLIKQLDTPRNRKKKQKPTQRIQQQQKLGAHRMSYTL